MSIPSPAEIAAEVERRIAESGGDGSAVCRQLIEDHQRAAAEAETLRSSLASAAEVPDGAVVLTGDDLARWNALKAAGITPDDVASLRTDSARLRRKEALRVAADLEGVDPDIAEVILPRDAVIAVRGEGRDQSVVIEVDGSPVPLADHLRDAYPAFAPVIHRPRPADVDPEPPRRKGTPKPYQPGSRPRPKPGEGLEPNDRQIKEELEQNVGGSDIF